MGPDCWDGGDLRGNLASHPKPVPLRELVWLRELCPDASGWRTTREMKRVTKAEQQPDE